MYGKEQATILNVLGKIPFDYRGHSVEEMNAAVAAGVKAAQEINAINDARREDLGWQNELEELRRRFQGLPSTESAEDALKALEGQVSEKVKEFKYRIKLAKDRETVRFMSAWEKSQSDRNVAELQSALSDYESSVRCPLAKARALVETCRTYNPKRKRFQELQARKAAIDSATATGKRSGFERQDQIHRRSGSENRMTF